MIPEEDIVTTIAVLEQLVGDRNLVISLPKEQREQLLQLAGRVAHPGRAARRQIVRANRQKRREDVEKQKERDENVLANTGIRLAPDQPFAPPQPFDAPMPPTSEHCEKHFTGEVEVARNCYICKRDYHRIHFFYDSLCPDCAEFNWQKRNQTADLSGRYALITGGRVKIGFHAALKLLRSGAHTIVTTRFPRDAAKRFTMEEDSNEWIDRLQIHGLDLRQTRAVEIFTGYLCETLPQLDFILNNACQTVRRPPGFYAHLMADERRAAGQLSGEARRLLAAHDSLTGTTDDTNSLSIDALTADGDQTSITSAELSQIPLTADDALNPVEIFPAGELDSDLQQVDLRKMNSWRLRLAEVSTVELLEVQLVNAVAPFILNARLKPLMNRTSTPDKHIVNVSAMEGVFYRAFKQDTHPHTNMAKAALNMMTRTSAADYIKDGIHMNSVDTGWITDEDPAEIAKRKKDELRFHTPLDQVDAAARICDPIFSGLNTGEHVWGKFLKDYQISNW